MNSIVSHYRAQFPDDQRTDDEITLAYAAQYGPDNLSSDYPDFGTDYKRLIQAAFPPSVGDYAKQFVGSGIRGVTDTVASGLESAAVLGRELGQRSEPSFDPSHKAEPFEEASGIPGLVRRAGQAVSPAPVEGLEKSFLATKLPAALGSTAGFASTALLIPEAFIPRLAGVALMGAASGGAEGYKDALRHGSTAEQAATSGALNALVGTSEAFPLGRMLHRIDKMSGGTFGKALATSTKEGFEEAFQETVQGVSGDYIALNYDKNRKLFEDVASDAAAGGISGVVFSLLTSAIGAKLGRREPAAEGREEPSTPAAAPISEAQFATRTPQFANPTLSVEPTIAPVSEEPPPSDAPPTQEIILIGEAGGKLTDADVLEEHGDFFRENPVGTRIKFRYPEGGIGEGYVTGHGRKGSLRLEVKGKEYPEFIRLGEILESATDEPAPPSQELEDRARSIALQSLSDAQMRAVELEAQIERISEARSAALQVGYAAPIAEAAAKTNVVPTEVQEASSDPIQAIAQVSPAKPPELMTPAETPKAPRSATVKQEFDKLALDYVITSDIPFDDIVLQSSKDVHPGAKSTHNAEVQRIRRVVLSELGLKGDAKANETLAAALPLLKERIRRKADLETVALGDLPVGAEFTILGERFTVKDVNPDTGIVTIKDGDTIRADEGGIVKIDPGSLTKAELKSEFASDETTPLDFSKPESVEEQKARFAAEDAAKAAKLAKESVLDKASKPLVGTTGDLGQGDLLDAPKDLFAPPTPKPAELQKAETPESIYDLSVSDFRLASAKFRKIREAYRAKTIGDAEFLAGKEEFLKAEARADEAETQFISEKNKAESKSKPGRIEPTAEQVSQGAAPATFAGYDGTVAMFTLTEPVGNLAAGTTVTQAQLREAGYDVAPQLAAIRFHLEQLDAQRLYFEREIAELTSEIEASKAKPNAQGKLPKSAEAKINRLTFAQRKISEIDARRNALGHGPIQQLYPEDVDTRDTHDIEVQSGRKVFASFYILGDGSESSEALRHANGAGLHDQLLSGSSPKAGEQKQRTKRLTIFQRPDKTIAVLGTFRLPSGDMAANPTDPGAKEVSLESVLKLGYKPIGSIRTVLPLARASFFYPSLAAFKAEVADNALRALNAARESAVAVEEDIEQAGLDRQDERQAEEELDDAVEEAVQQSEAFPTEEAEKFQNVPGLSSSVFAAVENYLTDKVGKRDNLDHANLGIALADAIQEVPDFRTTIARATNKQTKAEKHLFYSVYEAYKQIEGIAEAETRRAAFQAALGSRAGVVETDSSDAAFRLVAEAARTTGRGYSDPVSVASRFNRVIDALRARGQDVLLFQRRLNSLFTDIVGGEAAGFIAPKFNTIVLALEDLQAPSHFSIGTALHEAVEFETRALPDEMRARLHSAVQQLSDDALGVSNAADPRARQANPAGLPPDQLVRELLAERLASRGIGDATDLAARLWRFVKDIYLRVSIAFQQTLFGEQAVRSETILAWWDNHMENFVNGTLGEGLLAWFGGGRLTVAGQLRAYESVGPSFMPVEILDWRRERMTYADLVPETLEAMLLNAEFQKAPRRSDPEEPSGENDPTSRVTIDVAANNEVDAALQGMNAVWSGVGLNTMGLGTYQQFATEILQINPRHLPQAKIAAVNQVLTNNGHAAANPTARLTTFTSNTFAGEAAVKGLKQLQGLRHRMGRRRGVAQELADRDDAKLKRNNKKLSDWSNKKSGLDVLFTYASDDIKTLLRDFKSDLRAQGKLNRKYGALLQAAKDLQELRDDPVPASHEQLMEDMAAKITRESQSFMDTLRAVARLNINWQSTPLVSHGGQQGIRDRIANSAALDPALKPLEDRPGLLAIVASFARTNDALMTLLAVRESQATNDAEAIRKMIEQAFSDTSQDLQETRKKISEVISLKAEAAKLFEHIRAVRLENDRLSRDINRNRAFVAAHDATRAELDSHLSRVQKFLGVGDPVYFYHGEMIPVPQRPGATLDEIASERRVDSTELLHWVRFQQYDDNGRQAASLDANLNRIRAWLDANPQHEGSALYRKLEEAERGLKMMSADTRHYGLKRSLLGSVLGSIATLAENTGTASGRRAGERIRKHVAISQGYADELRELGIKVGKLKGESKGVLGVKDDETFYNMFYDGPLSLLESNKALNEAPNPMTARLAAIRLYLTSNTHTSHALTNPKAWPALEKFYLASAEFSTQMVKVKSAMGVKVKDDVIGLFRESIGDPLSTMQRSFRPEVAAWIKAMAPLWNGSQRMRLTEQFVAQQLVNNPKGFARDLKERFTEEVLEQFVKPLANHPGRSLFSGKTVAGQWTLANRADVIDAFRNANGDVLQFALGLKASTGATVSDEIFIAETLASLQNYFNAVEGDMNRHAGIRNAEGLATLGIMNARSAEWAPPEWLRYARFDQNYARYTTIRLAYHAAFGVNGEAILHDFAAAQRELEDVLGQAALVRKEISALYPGRSKDWLDRQLKIELQKRKLDVEKHLSAESHLADIKTAHTKFNAQFENQGDGQVEMRGFMEALHTVTGLMVQGPKTMLIDTTTMFNNVITLGPNKLALRQIRNNWAHFASNAFGSLLNTIGIASHWNLDMANRRQDAGLNDTSLSVPWRDRVAAIRASDKSYLVQASRIARETLTQATVADIPLLGRLANRQGQFAGLRLPTAMFTQAGIWMHHALIESNWKTYDDMVLRAVKYLESNPALIGRKDVSLTMANLEYSRRLGIFSEERAFLYMTEALQKHGMTIEGLANAAIARRKVNPGDKRLFTREQDMRLASLAVSELNAEGNISNNPTFLYNPALRASALLLAWSFRYSDSLRRTFREPSGAWSYRALLNGMSVMMALVPLGLAYAFLMDEFDEEITGKKSNIRGFGQDSNGLAALEQLSRMGMFGLWGDLGNTVGNFAGEGDLRGLSIDNRVVWVNSMLNIFRTVGTYLRQGEATYDTVYRPLLQSIGGSGYLQVAQIINNTLDLDNPESRVTRRINAQNYLRAAGRELEMDVRGGRGGAFSLPNAIKPHIGQMVLAALADDQADFYAAYQDAVEAAREEGKDDPADHVKRSFVAYHPLRTVFRTSPSDSEYRQILSVLPDDGRQDVSEAIILFERYGGKLGLRPISSPRVGRPRATAPSFQSIRSRALAF